MKRETVVRWLVVIALLLALDGFDKLTHAPTIDPLHPQAPAWHKQPLVPRVPLRHVCWDHARLQPGGPGCWYVVVHSQA